MSPDQVSEMLARLSTMEQLLSRILVALDPPLPVGLLKEAFDGQKPRSWPTQPGSSRILAKQPPAPDWIAVLHRKKYTVSPPPTSEDGPHQVEQAGCGMVALYLTRPFSTRERADITAMRVCFPNEIQWRQPKPGDISLCSTCGMPINPWSDRDLDYASVLVEVPEVHRVQRRSRMTPLLPSSESVTASIPLHTPEADAQNRAQIADLLAAADELLADSEESDA